MAIQLKKSAREKLGAKMVELPVTPFKVALHTSQPPAPVDVDKIANAVTLALDAQRQGLGAVAYQFALALEKLKIPVGWQGNWDVHITKRDALGRISEVQFKPAKP